jgi:hypothetical protein
MLNHGSTLVQLLHCLSLSSCQIESNHPPAAQLPLSQCQQDELVGRHLWLSKVPERKSRTICEPFYATKTSHRKQQTFLYNVLCIESFCPQITQKWITLFGDILLKHCRHFDYWNQHLKMRMRVYYLDWHKLCCYLLIQIESFLLQ